MPFDQCASVLQVLEETGFDVGSRLKTNDYIEIHMQEKRSRLYIIQGVWPLMLMMHPTRVPSTLCKSPGCHDCILVVRHVAV